MKECPTCKRCFADAATFCPDDGATTNHTISGEPILEGKYILEKRLGQGGMGVVYRATHKFLKTALAIKVILPDLVGNDPQLVTRFRQEALAAAAIRHPNVVAVSDFGVADGTMPFLVMEFVQGESLHDLLTRENRLAPEKALEIMSAICAGVGAAHRQGIVHRDLKPLNVIIQEGRPLNEAVKILDFGLAKIKSGELLGSFVQAQTTGLMGSPYYMAPEQWADEEPDGEADVYSLGVMLFQMLAGDVPFKGSSIPAIMKKHLTDAPTSFADLGVQISPELEKTVLHSLEKDRKLRTPSVEKLVEEMREAVGFGGNTQSGNTQPTFGASVRASSLRILTYPAESEVFLDNVPVGKSQPDGWLLVKGVLNGEHFVRITHEDYEVWDGKVTCDGNSQQVMANLRPIGGTKPKAEALIDGGNTQNTGVSTQHIQVLQSDPNQGQKTMGTDWKTNQANNFVASQNLSAPQKSFLPYVLAGIIGLLVLSSLGVGLAYFGGMFSGGNVGGVSPTPKPIGNTGNTAASPTPAILTKTEMVKIPGGTFKMGRNDGPLEEQPAHEVTVNDFLMDKTEVTNAEYAEFVREKKYPAPSHWKDGKPLEGQEMRPVTFVSLEDAKNFAKWRSERDKVDYRLPTEEEWEYAARNGTDATMFPWGNSWENGKAVIEESAVKPVGSIPEGKNKWGVFDLIGNVYEWTDTVSALYKGNNAQVDKSKLEGKYIIRGGGFKSESRGKVAMTATFRGAAVLPDKKDDGLGFRLVQTLK